MAERDTGGRVLLACSASSRSACAQDTLKLISNHPLSLSHPYLSKIKVHLVITFYFHCQRGIHPLIKAMPFDGNRNRITLSLNVNLTFLRARIKMMGGFGKWPFCWVHPSSSSTRPSGLVGSSTSMQHLNAALKLGVHNLFYLHSFTIVMARLLVGTNKRYENQRQVPD